MTVVFQEVQYVKPTGTVRNGYYLDNNLLYYLDNFLIKGVEKDHDAICLWTGLEGTGKSTHVQAVAHYCDPTFTIDRVVFTGKDLMDEIDKAKPGQAIIFDEAIMDMAAQDFATEMQKILIKKFTLIRKKKLFIFIVIPSIFMLRKYFAIFRTRCMVNCFCPDGITRGRFRFYSFAKKKQLYLRGYKEMDMGCVKPTFLGNFTNTYGYIVNADEYENKKDEAIKKLTEDKGGKEEKLKQAFEDQKLKLKLDVHSFKEKWRDKFGELKAKNKLELQKLKEKYKHSIGDIREEALTLQKSKDKKRIQELERDYHKLLYFFYNWESERYKKSKLQDLRAADFAVILSQNKVMDIKTIPLKHQLDKGKQLMELEI